MDDDRNRLLLPVCIQMNDGRELNGELVVNIGGVLERTLNSDAKFILFRDLNGSEYFIAKTGILECQARKATKAVGLPAAKVQESSDPYTLLGIAKTATDEQIRAAFLERSKDYHSDRFASVSLPREVAEYTDSMSRRINEAYALLMQGKTPEIVLQQPAHG